MNWKEVTFKKSLKNLKRKRKKTKRRDPGKDRHSMEVWF